MYRKRFSKLFIKLSKKLDVKNRDLLLKHLERILENPYKDPIFVYKKKRYRKHRFGDYRIIYKVDGKEKRIIFYVVDHRKRIYKRHRL